MIKYRETSGCYLFLIWLLHSGLVLFLSFVNPNHYTTVDSCYYLESAGNLLSGNGYTLFDRGIYLWNSTFPPGYALAISAVSFITKTEVLLASKLVNMISSGIWLICLGRWFGKDKALVISFMLLLGPFLKLWAHTWSEPLFLTVLSGWVFHLHGVDREPCFSTKRTGYLFLLGVLLILIRYAGVFIIPLTFLYSFASWLKKDKSGVLLYTSLASTWLALFVLYLGVNRIQSGTWSGGSRLDGRINFHENAIAFTKGLLNELFLIRNTDFKSPGTLFYLGLVIQVVILMSCMIPFRYKVPGKKADRVTFTLWLTALFYLVFLFAIRIFSPFDPPGYRLLSPFSFLFLTGILAASAMKHVTLRNKFLMLILVVLSWVDILPEKNLEEKLPDVFRIIDKNFH